MRRTIIACALVAGIAGSNALAAGGKDSVSAGPEPPKEREYSYIYDLFTNSVVRPVAHQLDFPRLLRKATRHPIEAANVDENDQVRLPSTWWQPRIGFRPVSVERMLKGPGPGTGPAPGKWIVTKAKGQGITPGFQIKDSKGDKFLIKFDPPKYPDMPTGVEIIGTYLFWAAGYNVPDNAIATFVPESLVIHDEATIVDASGKKRKMTREYLYQLLAKVGRQRDGRYRCMASRFLSGKPLGPFKYEGRRKDDREDLIPHQLRRELRGLWAMAAWTNHADIRGPNSLDTWVTENGRSFVRHHLIDFGSILGSSAVAAKEWATGYEYYVDFGVMAKHLPVLGLTPFAWEPIVDPRIAAVGAVESAHFNAGDWRPDFPNPAFDERTERDINWGVRIVAGFTDDHIRAAVAAARYTDPRASAYLTQVLIERRDKLVQRWLGPKQGASIPATAR